MNMSIPNMLMNITNTLASNASALQMAGSIMN